MSELNVQEQVKEQVQGEDAKKEIKEEVKSEDILLQIKEQHKKELAGLNRRNEELRKQIQDKDLEKLSAEERLKEEIRLAKEEKEKIETETEKIKRERIIDKLLFDAGLPQKFSSRINGKEENEIEKDILDFQNFINAEAEKRAEAIINQRLGGKAPSGGAVIDEGHQALYDNARKSGNMAQAIAIKRAAQKEGITLK